MNQSNNRGSGFPILPALLLFGMIAVTLILLLPAAQEVKVAEASLPQPTAIPPTPIPTPTTEATAEVTEETAIADASALDPVMVASGQTNFAGTCSACHGMNALGVPNLGKDLVHSTFVNGLTDEELVTFISTGRPVYDPANTTGVEMPARGGNAALTDDQLYEIAAYLRSLALAEGLSPVSLAESSSQTRATAVPMGVAELPETTAQPEATEIVYSIPGANITGENVVLPEREPPSVEQVYAWSCSGCHAADGSGLERIGPALAGSDALASADAFAEFLTAVHPYGDPNVEYPHPVRGGYPPLTDEEIAQLAEYVRGLVGAN